MSTPLDKWVCGCGWRLEAPITDREASLVTIAAHEAPAMNSGSRHAVVKVSERRRRRRVKKGPQ